MSAVALTEAEAFRIVREVSRRAFKDKSYRRWPVGGEVGRYLRTLRWADASANTLQAYELVLSRLAVDHRDLELTDFEPPVGTERVREFLDVHWGDASPATRANRVAIVRSFFRWAHEEGRISGNPTLSIKAPRRRQVDRPGHSREHIRQLLAAQPSLSDRVALQLMARRGLRKDEVRRLQMKHFDLARGTVTIRQKGGTRVTIPIVFEDLRLDLERLFLERQPELAEYLLYPHSHKTTPMNPATTHRWWSRCLERAELPHFGMHGLRHFAGTELQRAGHDIKATQLFMRHKSARTTLDVYMRYDETDLVDAMKATDAVWRDDAEGN